MDSARPAFLQTLVRRHKAETLVAALLSCSIGIQALAHEPTTATPDPALAGLSGIAGHREGSFFFSDSQGFNTLHLGGYMQLRYLANFRDDAIQPSPEPSQELTHGFEVRKVHAHAFGSIAEPELTYHVSGEFESEGAIAMEDAWFRYEFADSPWRLRAGQFTAQILREEDVGEDVGLALERSVVNELFRQDVSQGLELRFESQQYRASLALTDGFDSVFRTSASSQPFDSPAEADVAASLRGEWLFSGSDWSRMDGFTSWRSNSTFAGMVGGAIALQSFGRTGSSADPLADGGEMTATLDVSLQGPGWNGMGAIGYTRNETGDLSNAGAFGTVAQGGYFIADQVELYARAEWIHLDRDLFPGDHSIHLGTLGVNYFPIAESQALRLSADVVHAFDATTMLPLEGTATGLLGSGNDGETVVRLQLNVRF